MRVLDRYIIRSFLTNFVILTFVLMALFVVIDFVVDVDEFLKAGPERARAAELEKIALEYDIPARDLRHQVGYSLEPQPLADRFDLTPDQGRDITDRLTVPWLRGAGWTLYVIADYYLPTVVMIYILFSGLLVTAAMGFTLSAMQRNRELTALVAGGVSLYRVAAPVLVAGLFLVGLTLPLQEFAVPAMADKLLRSKSNLKLGQVRTKAIYFTPEAGQALWSAGGFDMDPETGRATLQDVRVVVRDPERLTMNRWLSAPNAQWDAASESWVFDPPARVAEPVLARDPASTVTPAAPADRVVQSLPSELSPTVLLARQAKLYLRLLPIATLRDLQANPAVDPAMRSEITRIVWGRFSVLALGGLILAMGLPFFLLRAPEPLLKQSLKAAGLTIAAWGGGLVAMQVGSGAVPPVLGAWLPVILNLPFAAAALASIRS
ncbi:MAG: LptF/LptG family permease [Planctomycetota bacterium]